MQIPRLTPLLRHAPHRALTSVHRVLMASDDRGDVPGWVLVSVMTAGLVTGLWVVADEQLTAVLGRAIGSVTTP